MLVLGAIGVAVSRILLGVHYPVDVAASAVIGAVSAAIVTWCARPYVTWVVRQASRLSDPSSPRLAASLPGTAGCIATAQTGNAFGNRRKGSR